MFKKIIFVLIVALGASTFANAQNIKLGVKGGLNTSTISGFDKVIGLLDDLDEAIEGIEIGDVSTSYKLGFHLGVVAQYESGNFFLQPELLFSQIGLSTKIEGKSERGNLNYLQLPVYAGYKTSVGDGLDLLLGAGPFVAYGISGTENPFNKKDDGRLKRFDAGLSFMAGIQLDKIQIALGYDLGLVDMVDVPGWKTAKDFLGLSSITNRNIKVSLAYFF
jgi:hypothetical protein